MDKFSNRKGIFPAVVIAVLAIITARLFYIQIIKTDYRINAENNAYKYETRYPARGLIRDRYGKIMVDNKVSYDIQVTPYNVTGFDTLEFCSIFDADTTFIRDKFAEFRKYRTRIGYQSRVLLKQVSAEQYNVFAEKKYRYPGFSGIPRTSRTYSCTAGGNLLGYISEVDGDFIKKHPEYRSGDYAGKTGIEEAYEYALRGEKGYAIYLRDARNRVVGRYDDGRSDKTAVAGTDIYTTIDVELQEFGERLMSNKVGSVVAIEPSTGEILSMVSSPGISVDQLAGISRNYNALISDPYRPMFNRAVMSPQPPGSVFKLVNGLIGLQEGVITPQSAFPCSRGFHVGNLTVGCHSHPSPLDLYHGIMMSCNAYFCYTFRAIIDNKKYRNTREAFEKWVEYVKSFGFGTKLGSDISAESAGTLPTAARYDKLHGKNRWKSLSIISLSIGQGELGCTPLHLANLAATIANRGFFYTPHLRKDMPEFPIDDRFKTKRYTMVDTVYFHDIVKGMEMAVNGGPGSTAGIAAIPGVQVCGKTGTAQNPHGDDHSVFICFAPKDNPRIAVAAYIENGGFGAAWAAPIASLMVEKYLNGEISDGERKNLEQKMVDANLLYKVKVRRK